MQAGKWFRAGIGLAAALGLGAAAHADSLIATHSGNGPVLAAQVVSAGFLGPDPASSDIVSAGPDVAFAPFSYPLSGGETQSASSALAAPLTPDFGGGFVDGGIDMLLTYGTGGTNDLLQIVADGVVSAESARDSGPGGAQQDAFISLQASMDVFIDVRAGALPGGYVGDFSMGAIPLPGGLPSGVDSMARIFVFQDGVSVFDGDGSSAFTVPLFAGHGYRLVFSYGMHVPHGVDPPFSFTASGSFNPLPPAVVPEPATAALLGFGLAALTVRQSRRARQR